MSRVFVVNEAITSRYKLDDLADIGKITFLYASNDRPPSMRNIDACAAEIVQRLKVHKFDPENDCLAVIGKQFDIAVLFYVAGLLIGAINVVLFDAGNSCYRVSRLRSDMLPDLVKQ